MPCIAEHGESWLVRKLRARTGKSNERNGQGLPITDWHRNTKSINSYIFGKLFSVLIWKKNSYFTITYILAIIKRKNRKTLLKIHKINFIPKLNSKFHVLFNISCFFTTILIHIATVLWVCYPVLADPWREREHGTHTTAYFWLTQQAPLGITRVDSELIPIPSP